MTSRSILSFTAFTRIGLGLISEGWNFFFFHFPLAEEHVKSRDPKYRVGIEKCQNNKTKKKEKKEATSYMHTITHSPTRAPQA